MIERTWRTAAQKSVRIREILGLPPPGVTVVDGVDNTPVQFRKLTDTVHDFFAYVIEHLKLDDERLLASCYELGVTHSSMGKSTFQV